MDRQLARRAARERRRRRITAGIGAGLAVLLIVAGVAWLGGVFDRSDEPADAAADDVCAWTPQNTENNPDLKDVGTPPTDGIPTSGTRPMTITTSQGAPIVVGLDATSAPCSAASFAHLASKNFYDNTECHEITAEGALRCGDPTGTGRGGPSYAFYNENVPAAPTPEPSASAAPASAPLYPKGTVALISDPPGNNGSQFLVFLKDYTPKDQALYPIVGSVTAGMETLTKISKIATVANAAGDKVKPKDKIVVQSLTVGDPVADGGAAPAPSASSQS
jgi:peptidyl-prolyl cis-trans isomerase B (cyclophilin B)